MVKILLAADFEINRTGILSTASSLLENFSIKYKVYSSQPIIGIESIELTNEELSNYRFELIFTHLEYSNLSHLINQNPKAFFHVGDWPLNYWKSLFRLKPLKSIFGYIRTTFRLKPISRDTKLIFVSKEDFTSALNYGFSKSIHLPIGVKASNLDLNKTIDWKKYCFTGNFDYEPNYVAAIELVNFFQTVTTDVSLIIAGFNANKVKISTKNNPKINFLTDLPSIVDFLTSNRPIYISPITIGAGSKNKILEALVSGCPVLCTRESLDQSIEKDEHIFIIQRIEEIHTFQKNIQIPKIKNHIVQASERTRSKLIKERDWKSLAMRLEELLKS